MHSGSSINLPVTALPVPEITNHAPGLLAQMFAMRNSRTGPPSVSRNVTETATLPWGSFAGVLLTKLSIPLFRRALVLSSLPLFTAAAVSAATIDPIDMRGIRDVGGGPFLLGFGSVKITPDDRTIAHFDISSVGTYDTAELAIGIDQSFGNPGTFAVSAFFGDGEVSPDEFPFGAVIATFSGIGLGPSNLKLDITSLLDGALSRGETILSFKFLNTNGIGQYFTAHVIDGVPGSISGAGPTFIALDEGIAAVPLPAGGLLLLAAIGALLGARRLT